MICSDFAAPEKAVDDGIVDKGERKVGICPNRRRLNGGLGNTQFHILAEFAAS